MKGLRKNKFGSKNALILGAVLLLGNCAQMSQQKAGHTGAAVGAVVGSLGMAALAKKEGGRGSDLVAPAAFGALAGGAFGNSIGQKTGMQGVYKTEVPNE